MINKHPDILIEGAIYQHFKGGRYKLAFLSNHTETREELVNYVSLSDGEAHSRPLAMFLENVKKEDGTEVPRFRLLTTKEKKDAGLA